MALFVEIKRISANVSPLNGIVLVRYNGRCEKFTTLDFADCKEQAYPPRRNKFGQLLPGEVIRSWDDNNRSWKYYERLT